MCPSILASSGWGQEDQAFGEALWTLHGGPWIGEAPLLHLWHRASAASESRLGLAGGQGAVSALSPRLQRSIGNANSSVRLTVLSNLLNQPVTVVSRAYGDTADNYGTQVPTEATTDVLACIQQITEPRRAATCRKPPICSILPAGTAITADDVVIDDHGLRYEVIGPPSHVRNPRTGTQTSR